MSEHPKKVSPAIDLRGFPMHGRYYEFKNGVNILWHPDGHTFSDTSYIIPPHYNLGKIHYFYEVKK